MKILTSSLIGPHRSIKGDKRKRFVEIAARAAAGIGSPVKFFFCASDKKGLPFASEVFTLKRTRRSTPHKENSIPPTMANKDKEDPGCKERLRKIKTEGATPNDTASERESNIKPNSLSACIILATAPSKRSARAAKSNKTTLAYIIWYKPVAGSSKVTLKIANKPQESPKAVITLGTRLIFLIRNSLGKIYVQALTSLILPQRGFFSPREREFRASKKFRKTLQLQEKKHKSAKIFPSFFSVDVKTLTTIYGILRTELLLDVVPGKTKHLIIS